MTDKPLQIDVAYWSDRQNSDPVAISTARAWLNQVNGDGYLEMTSGNGRIEIADNIVLIRVLEADMTALPAGPPGSPIEYDFEVLVTDTNGGYHPQLGKVGLLAGLDE